ncbi:hypothetical protein C8R44DRAFT_724912 [Mycena epipterygia]|nr:hypothetical protein C8R44DRAFT_724912 [Mycena epipterygia]
MLILTSKIILSATTFLPVLSQQVVFPSSVDDSSQWTTFPHPISRVAVIGAGPTGLQAAAHLLAANLSVRFFERAPSSGGNWFYTEDTPVREEYPNERNSPATFQLPFTTKTARMESGWRIAGKSTDNLVLYGTTCTQTAPHHGQFPCMTSNGLHTTPYVPAIEGIGNWSNAMQHGKHSVYHSQSYRHPERYSGKTVLIVGRSASATEIARSIAPFTHRLIASVRVGQAEIVPEISSFEPLNANDIGIKAGKIRLGNGTVLEGIDEVILATVYRPNDFVPDFVNPRMQDNLHWTGHYIDDSTLAYASDIAAVVRPRSKFVAWLNCESLELGGQFVEPRQSKREKPKRTSCTLGGKRTIPSQSTIMQVNWLAAKCRAPNDSAFDTIVPDIICNDSEDGDEQYSSNKQRDRPTPTGGRDMQACLVVPNRRNNQPKVDRGLRYDPGLIPAERAECEAITSDGRVFAVREEILSVDKREQQEGGGKLD